MRLGRHGVVGERACLPEHPGWPRAGGRHQDRYRRHRDQGWLCPSDRSRSRFEVTPRWSIWASSQFNFHETLAPAPARSMPPASAWAGVPAAVGEAAGRGRVRRLHRLLVSFGRRRHPPKKTGQWGWVRATRVTDETEVGLYYLDYSVRTADQRVSPRAPRCRRSSTCRAKPDRQQLVPGAFASTT